MSNSGFGREEKRREATRAGLLGAFGLGDSYVSKALWIAVTSGDIFLVKSLVEKKANFSTVKPPIPLLTLAVMASSHMTRYLVKEGVREGIGCALNLAVANGSVDTLKAFLGAGVNLNNPCFVDPGKKGFGRIRPLMLAVMQNKLDCARILLENGALPNEQTVSGKFTAGTTPLSYAMSKYQSKMMRLLVSHGAQENGISPEAMVAINKKQLDSASSELGENGKLQGQFNLFKTIIAKKLGVTLYSSAENKCAFYLGLWLSSVGAIPKTLDDCFPLSLDNLASLNPLQVTQAVCHICSALGAGSWAGFRDLKKEDRALIKGLKKATRGQSPTPTQKVRLSLPAVVFYVGQAFQVAQAMTELDALSAKVGKMSDARFGHKKTSILKGWIAMCKAYPYIKENVPEGMVFEALDKDGFLELLDSIYAPLTKLKDYLQGLTVEQVVEQLQSQATQKNASKFAANIAEHGAGVLGGMIGQKEVGAAPAGPLSVSFLLSRSGQAQLSMTGSGPRANISISMP